MVLVKPSAEQIQEAKKAQDVQDALDIQIVEHYLKMDRKGEFLNPPSTDEQLDEFIQCAYGVRIPRKVVTPGHRAPFEFVSDLFFERTTNALGFANRTGGKTKAVSILNHLDMLFKPGCEIASAGAVLDQADKCYRYFLEYTNKKWFIKFCKEFKQRFGRAFLGKSLQSYTKFGNNSLLEIITGTEKGLRSPHPHKARLDEIDLMPWSSIQTAFSMAKSSGGIAGQYTLTSTRQMEEGTMQKLLDTSAEKGIEVYEWDIWEAVEKCTRRCENDPTYGTCPIYRFCRGKAHHCDGFYSINDFISKVRLLDQTTFDTEWTNLKPARHKQVYWMFDRTRNILTPATLRALAGVEKPLTSWFRIGAIDFGSSPGHPFVYLKIFQIPNVHAWLIYYEYVQEQRLLRDHAQKIKTSPFYLPGELIFADHDAQDRLELAAHGVHTKPAIKDVVVGLDYVGALLQGYPPYFRPALYVWYECQHTIREFNTYSWPVLAGGKIDRTGLPEKKNDHCMDGARYALLSYRDKRAEGYKAHKVTGV